MVSKILKVGGVLMLVLVAACQLPDTRMAAQSVSDQHEAIYLARLEAVLKNGGLLAEYDPLELVPGAAEHRPLPSGVGSISQRALQAAEDYAVASNASAFLILQDDLLLREIYSGSASRHTPLLSRSFSKPLTAIAVGRAIERGDILSLNQPVSDFIDEWKGTDKAAIKVRHLLDMRSGLLMQGYSTDPDSPWNRAYLSPDHGTYLVQAYPLTDPPGERYAYSNATSELVAVLIERATGMRYADFLGEEILSPIGAMGGTIWVSQAGGLAHSGCCMYLPAETWLRLGKLILDDGKVGQRRLLAEGFVKEMKAGTPQNPNYGLGLWIGEPYSNRRGFTGAGGPGPQVLHTEPYLDEEMVLFDGASNQVLYISPRHRLVILRMGPAAPREPEWDNSAIPNLLFRGLQD